MSLTINHQTNDISATSGSVTIGGTAVGGAGVHTLINTTKITSTTANITVTGIDAKYKIVLVKLALRGGSNASGLSMKFGIDGTIATGNIYTTGSNSVGYMQICAGAAKQQNAGHLEIFNLGDSGARTVVFKKLAEMTDDFTEMYSNDGKFSTRNNTAYNTFQLYGTFGSSFTSGFVNTYGIADS